jgi:hypothetical protein
MNINDSSIRIILIFALSVLCLEVLAGPTASFKVKTLKRFDWQFPVLIGTNKKATERINDVIFAEIFGDNFDGIPTKDPEQRLTILDKKLSRSLTNLSFQVLRNDERIFSILFDAEGCGAYCEGFSTPLAFDSNTGRLLTDIDLFTDQGRKDLSMEIAKRNQETIRNQLAKLQNIKSSSEGLSGEDIANAIEMYTECLGNWQSKDWQKWVGKMEFRADGIVFEHGRCSIHALQALDDLGDLRNAFSYVALKPRLTPYGRNVLLGEATAGGEPVSPVGQLLKGTLAGKMQITLYLEKPEGVNLDNNSEINGYYFYDRYRKPLKIRGKFQNGKIILDEFDQSETAQAEFILTNQHGSLQGEWKSRDGAKILAVKFEP